jgi:uncharacterized protein (TIGR03382 family)
MRRSIALVLAALAAVAAVAGSAAAYVRSIDSVTGACLYWTRRELHWSLNEKATPEAPLELVERALVRGFQAWTDAACSDVALVYDGRTSRADVGFDPGRTDQVNLVVWREKDCDERGVVPDGDPCGADPSPFACADKYGCWSHTSSIIALTTTNYNRNTGVIVDGDVEFNGALRFTAFEEEDLPKCPVSLGSCTETDVQNAAAHEAGHLLGLAHTPDADATMFASAPAGETKKRTLAADDAAGLCEIYPSGAVPATCTPSGRITITQTGSSRTGCTSAGATALGPVALLAAWLVRRRRAQTA